MIQIFSLTLAANEAREVAVQGEYFEIRNALYPIELIELLDRSGGVIARLENPEQSDFVKPGRYETIRITNGPTPQTVRHFYGSGDAGSRRTSGRVQVEGTVSVMGDVSVIDGGKARTIAGNAFYTTMGQGAVGGLYSSLALFNPLASGKSVVIEKFSLSASIACQAYAGFVAAALAGSAAVPAGNSKYSQGRVSAALRGQQALAAGLVAVPMMILAVQANQLLTVTLTEPVVLEPGAGFALQNAAVNLDLTGNFEYFEQ